MSLIPFSTASFSNLPLMEALYQQYLQDPASVDASWRAFFDGFEFGGKIGGGEASPELKVHALIEGYRTYGHLLADFNPLATKKVAEAPELELKHFGLSAKDLGQMVPTCGFLKRERVYAPDAHRRAEKDLLQSDRDRIHGPRQSADGSLGAEKNRAQF